MFDRTLLLKLAQKHESFYLYDQRVMLSHLFQLRSAIPWAHFLYSVKANPHHAVLDTIFSQGFGGDAASLGEVELCRMHGLKPEEIFFSAPGKPASALAGALGRCVLVADSLGETGGRNMLSLANSWLLKFRKNRKAGANTSGGQ